MLHNGNNEWERSNCQVSHILVLTSNNDSVFSQGDDDDDLVLRYPDNFDGKLNL